MAHKFPSIKAITVLCKSAENFILITPFHLGANEFGKKVDQQTFFPLSSAFELIFISNTRFRLEVGFVLTDFSWTASASN